VNETKPDSEIQRLMRKAALEVEITLNDSPMENPKTLRFALIVWPDIPGEVVVYHMTNACDANCLEILGKYTRAWEKTND
jgi:hypothetical protein